MKPAAHIASPSKYTVNIDRGIVMSISDVAPIVERNDFFQNFRSSRQRLSCHKIICGTVLRTNGPDPAVAERASDLAESNQAPSEVV